MSITVRQWNDEELEKVVKGDNWLATILANCKSFSDRAIRTYSQIRYKIKQYDVYFADDGMSIFSECVTIFATDEAMLHKFISAEYTSSPCEIKQVITTYVNVSIPFNKRKIPQPTA